LQLFSALQQPASSNVVLWNGLHVVGRLMLTKELLMLYTVIIIIIIPSSHSINAMLYTVVWENVVQP
jgi:hypothetical protein